MELVELYVRGQGSPARVRDKAAQRPLALCGILGHTVLWRYKNSLQVKRELSGGVGCDPMKLKRG
jgi:hypothetical protein